MTGRYRWCSWCCNLRYPLCCDCEMCSDCCNCPPPQLDPHEAPERLPDLPSMGKPPPPVRIIRERVMVPVPYPVYPKSGSCLPRLWDEPRENYEQSYRDIRDRPRTPNYHDRHDPRRNPGGGRPVSPRHRREKNNGSGNKGSCDPCRYRPRTPVNFAPPKRRSCCDDDPCQRSNGDGRSRCNPYGCGGGVLERSHPCPFPSTCRKRIHMQGQSIIPGYKGHVPGMRFHAAGRSYGEATRDTCCIMSQWGECCPELPCRIFEQ